MLESSSWQKFYFRSKASADVGIGMFPVNAEGDSCHCSDGFSCLREASPPYVLRDHCTVAFIQYYSSLCLVFMP